MKTSRYHFIKAAIRASVSERCAEAARYNPRFQKAAEYWAASAIYQLALGFMALALETKSSKLRADASS